MTFSCCSVWEIISEMITLTSKNFFPLYKCWYAQLINYCLTVNLCKSIYNLFKLFQMYFLFQLLHYLQVIFCRVTQALSIFNYNKTYKSHGLGNDLNEEQSATACSTVVPSSKALFSVHKRTQNILAVMREAICKSSTLTLDMKL